MARILALALPMLELDAAHQVPRAWKGRDPALIHQHRVPADVIDMEMRAQHRVDRLARESRRREILEKPALHAVPRRHGAVLLVVADAGVDDEATTRRLHHERMHAHLEAALVI